MKLFSPSKINLFFRVLKKREDGFHEIATLMQAISLGDTLTFEEGEQDLLTSSVSSLRCDETNLISQACTLFRHKTGFKTPYAIHVEKRIPMESGLGGGSGNVATTLWALSELSGLKIEEETLRAWAGEISSDAPFFFSTGTAYAEGRGEVVESLPPLERRSLWLAKPEGKGLSTPLVYTHCIPNKNSLDPKRMLQDRVFLNDLEFPAFKLRPHLAKVKEDLFKLGFETVLMTGSGTTFFCLGEGNPFLSGVEFFPVDFISRKVGWYEA